MNEPRALPSNYDRRTFLGGGAAAWALACASPGEQERTDSQSGSRAAPVTARTGFPVLIGSANGLAGMQRFYELCVRHAICPAGRPPQLAAVTEGD